MLKLSELDPISEDAVDFSAWVLEHNIALFKRGVKNQAEFYDTLADLAGFGEMVHSTKFDYGINCKIFLECYNDYSYYNQRNYKYKYHAIDSTGLSYGFVYGPETLDQNVNSKFFGTSGIWEQQYDCAIDMQPGLNGQPMDLTRLRAEFLPLPKEILYTESGADNYYFSRNRRNEQTHGSLIYRTPDQSFYLPFIELLRGVIHITTTGYLSTICHYDAKDDAFTFSIGASWHTFLCDHTQGWTGRISRETFEVIQIEEAYKTSESTK